MDTFISIMQGTITIAAVYLFGCVGETITEKVGNLNLGIPGIMSIGALGGIVGVNIYCYMIPDYYSTIGLLTMSILFALIFSAIAGLIYAFFTVTLKSNQNVTGLVLTTFGLGIMKGLGKILYDSSLEGIARYRNASIAIKKLFVGAENLGWFGQIFLSYGFLVYLAFILAIIAHFVLKYTKVGLYGRAVGESPQTADAQGINVEKYKYFYIIIGASIAGLGGLYYAMDKTNGTSFLELDIAAFGWVAVALVIFSLWKPLLGILGSLLFGFLFIIGSYIQTSSNGLFSIVPYVVTIIILIITSIFNKRSQQAPASLGVNYDREER